LADKDTKKPAVKLPKSPAAVADLLYKTREARYKVQKEVEKLKAVETACTEFFINSLPADTSGVAGKVARVQVDTKPVPQVKDWDAFYKYVARNKAFELLQRRLSDGAVKERWENGKVVPGVERFNAKTVSCTALKGK
jgi:hypothetical protein